MLLVSLLLIKSGHDALKRDAKRAYFIMLRCLALRGACSAQCCLTGLVLPEFNSKIFIPKFETVVRVPLFAFFRLNFISVFSPSVLSSLCSL